MPRLKRPNVLLIYTDQQRWDSLRCYGNQLAYTPNLDKLAEKGAIFRNYYVQSPVCMPSRMSMLSGRYCSSVGVGENGPSLPEDVIPVNQLLKPYGYHTAQIGKLHFDPHAKRNHKDPTSTYGFDTFILSDEPGCYDDAYTKWVEGIDATMLNYVRSSIPPEATHYNQPNYSDIPRDTHEPYVFEGAEDLTHSAFVADQTCEFIREHKDDRFFAIAGFFAPHTPINPPQRFVDLYDIDSMPLPVIGSDETFLPYLKDISEQEWKKIVAYYLALVSHLDDCVGKILNTLDDEGLTEDTVVIFTSDHGEYLGDHGKIQKGMPGNDCIIKVPFLMSYPPLVNKNVKFEQMVEAVDVVPTILDLCGIQTPRDVQGKSFTHLFSNDEGVHREDIYVEYFRHYGDRFATVRTKDYKYHTSTEGQEILYDLMKDPKELVNIAKDESYKAVLSEMRYRLVIRMMEAADNGRVPDANY